MPFNDLHDPVLAAALDTARASIPTQKAVTAERAWCGYTVVEDGARLAVFEEDAWTRPEEASVLAWSAPTGTPVARVDLDGVATLVAAPSPEGELDVTDLVPGHRFLYLYADEPIVVLVVGQQEPHKEFFGRPGFIQYMCRREDTGKQGYMSFGPGAKVKAVRQQ